MPGGVRTGAEVANVLLVNVPHAEDGEEVRRFRRPWPPLDLLNVGAVLEAVGHRVSLLDFRARDIDVRVCAELAEAADRIIITTTPLDRWQCPTLNTTPLFAFVRSFPADRTWVAGAHGTMEPEWVLAETGVAGLILGEPEGVAARVVACPPEKVTAGMAVVTSEGVEIQPSEPLDLTRLPAPAFHLLRPEDYRYELLGERFMVFETARGCPFACTFCSREMYGKAVRRKNVAQVVEEIQRARRETGFRCAYFIDLEFTFDRQPVVELCEQMMRRDLVFPWACQTRFDQVDEPLLRLMSRAGCRLIHFGVETGALRQVRRLRKGLDLATIRAQHAMVKRCGIDTALFLLFGHPGETSAEQRQTIDFAIDLDPTYASFHVASPYPGTEFHRQVGGEGRPFPSHDAASHALDDLEAMRRSALRRFYLRPRNIVRQLHPTRLPRALHGAWLLRQFLSH